MAKQVPHYERFPDYGVPYKSVGKRSWAQYILSYAAFTARINPPGIFTLSDYREFRTGEVRSETWRKAVKRLASLGYLMELPGGAVQITAKGYDANIRIAKRNAASRGSRKDDDD